MIGLFLSFLLSIWGVATLLMGFVTFFLFPVIGLASPFKGFSRVFLKLAAFPLKRAAIVVSEQNDIVFKQMSFLNLGLEEITLDGDDKEFEDPDGALHHWLGIPFALADEEHGILFDPRHAAMGMREEEYQKRGEEEYLATEGEYQEYGVAKWTPAAYAMPRLHEIVDLSAVQNLIDGGERAEYPERSEEFYKHSKDPFRDRASITKFLYPITAFSIPFFGIWIGVTQLGGPSETVQFGAVMWLLASLSGVDPKAKVKGAWAWLKSLDWAKIISAFVLVMIPVSIFAGLAVFLSPLYAIVISIVFLLGLLIMPLVTVIASPSAMIGGGLSKLYFKMGFMGFKRPVLNWTRQKYEIREYDSLETASQNSVQWYDLFGAVLGFTFEPEPESWGAEYMPNKEVEGRMPVTDGGTGEKRDTNLPKKYVRTDIKRDYYGGYLPRRVSDAYYYLHSGIALDRMTGSATGNKVLRKLLEAKDKHGAADDNVDEGFVFKATIVMGVFGALLGSGIFLLPALL